MSILNFKRKVLGHTMQMGGGGSSGGGGGSTQQSNSYSSLSPWASPYVTDMLGAAQAQVFSTTPTAATPGTQTQTGTDENGNPIYQTTPGTPAGNQITGMNPYNAFGSFNATGGQYGMNPSSMAAANSSVAQFSPLQNQSFQGAQNLQTPGQFGMATGAAGMGTMGSLNAGQNLQNQSTNPYAVGAYMNPYIQNALNPALQLSNQNYGMQGAAQQGAATQAGAFGGSRNALMQGLNQQNQMLANNQLIGNAYNTAYNNAQGQMNTVAQTGLQGYNQGIAGANTLANIGTGQLGAQTNILGTQNQYGQQQTAQQQAVINQAMQNYQTGQQYPWTQLTNLKNLVSGVPVTDTTQTMQSAAPSSASQLAGLGTTAIGALGMANSGGTTNINVPQAVPQAAAEGGIMSIKRMSSGGIGAINRQALLSPSSISKQEIATSTKDGAMAQPTGALAAAMQAQEQKQAQQAPQAPTSTVIQDIMGQQQQTQQQDVMAKLPMIMADLKVKMDIALEKGEKAKAEHYAAQLEELSALAQQAQGGQQQAPQSAPAPQGIEAAMAQPPQDPNAPAPQGIAGAGQQVPAGAGGGIVAFYKGGEVKKYDGTTNGSVATSDVPTSGWDRLLSNIGIDQNAAREQYLQGVKKQQDFEKVTREQPGFFTPTTTAQREKATADLAAAESARRGPSDAIKPDSLGRTSANMEEPKEKRDYSGIEVHSGKPAAPPSAPKEIASLDLFDATKQTNDVTSMINNWSNMLMGQYNQDNSGKNFWKGVMSAGAGMAAGTSPYGRANIGAGLQQGVGAWGQAEEKDAERKDKLLTQMMSLGLSGTQLKMEAAKLGIAAAEVPSKIDMQKGAAWKYTHPTAAAAGSPKGIPFAEMRKVEAEYAGYLQNPKTVLSSPLGKLIPPKTDKQNGWIRQGLEAKEGTPSYNKAMAAVEQIAEQSKNSIYQKGYLLGGRNTAPSVYSSEE